MQGFQPRLGISSGRDIARALSLATESGVGVLELACQHRGQWPEQISHSSRRSLRAEARTRELELVVHSDSAVNVAEPHPEIRAGVKTHLVEYLRLASDLGATRLVVHGGVHFDSSTRAQVLEAAADTLSAAASGAVNSGVTLVLENMNVLNSEIDYFGTTADDILDILDAVDSPALRACADLGHAHLLPGGIPAFVTALAQHIDYVQLTDNDGFVDRHLRLGAGTVDLTAVATSLAAIAYTGPVVIELDDEADRRTSLAVIRSALAH
jgi:sugar phosphate isomerase/epimerase